MNTYRTFKDNQEKLFNDFSKENLFFAFSDSQFKEWLIKLNAKEEEIGSIGSGGFIKKENASKYIEILKSMDYETIEFLKDENNLFSAFVYELANHEYCITYDHESTLDALWLHFETMTDIQKEILKKAKKDYLSHNKEY